MTPTTHLYKVTLKSGATVQFSCRNFTIQLHPLRYAQIESIEWEDSDSPNERLRPRLLYINPAEITAVVQLS